MDIWKLFLLYEHLRDIAYELDLSHFLHDVMEACTPGWHYEWTRDGISEAVDILLEAIFGHTT